MIVSFYAEVRGRSAHAGFRPEDGIHAIAAAAAAVSRLPSGRIDADTTFNIGKIAGGTAKNIVPDRVRMEGELRSRSAETAEAFERQAESVFREEAEKAGATAELRWDVNFPSFRVGDDSCIVRRFREACRTIGLKPKTVSTFGGSDNGRYPRTRDLMRLLQRAYRKGDGLRPGNGPDGRTAGGAGAVTIQKRERQFAG